jgi:hypothetical protein
MTPHIPEDFSTWFGWKLVTFLGDTMPPRDPNDDDDCRGRRRRMSEPSGQIKNMTDGLIRLDDMKPRCRRCRNSSTHASSRKLGNEAWK